MGPMRVVSLAALVCSTLLAFGSQNAPIERTIESIQAAIENGDQPGASRLLADALSRYPNEAGLLNLRGIIHAQRSELASARADFQQAVRLSPGLIPAWRNLGRACQLMTDPSAASCAIAAWQHVLRAAHEDAEAQSALATLYEWQGKFADSLHELEQLPPAEASHSPLLAVRCADLEGLQRSGEAAETARQLVRAPGFSEADAAAIFPVLESPPKSVQRAALVVALVEALDAQNKASAASLRRLAVAYEQLNRLPDARKTLEHVFSLDPTNPQHLLELARIAHLSHDLEGCLGYLAHARDLTPNDSRVHFLFGLVAIEMELPLEARKSLEKALALDPQNPDYNYSMGGFLLSAGKPADAVPRFATYVAAHPQDPRGHFALGAAYFASADYEQCRSQMLGIVQNPNTQAGAAYFLGRVESAEGNYDQALAYLEKAIKLLPSFAEGYTELARVRLRQGRLEAAHTAIGRALELDPDSYQANSTLLAFYQRTHDPRAEQQAARLQSLDAERSRKLDLMLRSIEMRPY
jgi:tetratricopeptide (TPR) repeat protein